MRVYYFPPNLLSHSVIAYNITLLKSLVEEEYLNPTYDKLPNQAI